jgi:signal peptidase II
VGEGRFAAGDTVTGEAPDVRCLSTGDRDADGDVDVFAVQHGKAVWYENAPRETITVIPGLLNIVPHEGNEQGAFGLGPSSPAFFVAAAGVALMVLLVLLWRVPAHRWHVHVALGLLVGGALGNLYDRLTRGSVRDFIDLHWQDWHWPTFNIADVAICIGFFIILLDSFRPAPEQEAPEDESDSQAAAVGE